LASVFIKILSLGTYTTLFHASKALWKLFSHEIPLVIPLGFQMVSKHCPFSFIFKLGNKVITRGKSDKWGRWGTITTTSVVWKQSL
jgi:hypothetical protein